MKVLKHLSAAFIAGLVGMAFLDVVLTDPPGAPDAFLFALCAGTGCLIVCVDQLRRAYRKLSRSYY